MENGLNSLINIELEDTFPLNILYGKIEYILKMNINHLGKY